MAHTKLKMTKCTKTFVVSGHADQLLKRMRNHLHAAKLADITLEAGIDKTKVPAHRLLLSSTSDYFCAMFSTPMKESTQTEIALQNIKGQTLKELVEFSYDGSIALNEKNVQDLLEAAVEYQFPDIVQLCCEFMYDQLAVDNCIGFYLFAKHFMLDRLSAQALEMICKEFEQVSLGDEFKQMPFEPLKNILNMDALNIVTEVNVFNAVKLWALFDENRKGQLSELLKYVRFTQLDAKTVERFCMEMENIDCGDVLQIVRKWAVNRKYSPKATVETTTRLMVLGGEKNSNLGYSSIEYFCPRFEKWKYWQNLPDARKNYAVAVMRNELYIIGGQLNDECLNTVYRLDLVTMKATSMPSMNVKRKNHAACVVHDAIYVIGGENEDGILSSVERFANPNATYDDEDVVSILSLNLADFTWEPMLSMKTPRNRPAVTMCDNEIYVIGGYADCQSSVETFNVVRKTWHDRAPMNSWRFGIGIAELDGYIFAVGGGYGSEHIDIVERYHRKQDMWTAMASFPGKSCSKLYALGEVLYAIGGRNAYKYNAEKDKWTKMATMNEERLTPSVFSIDFEDKIGFL